MLFSAGKNRLKGCTDFLSGEGKDIDYRLYTQMIPNAPCMGIVTYIWLQFMANEDHISHGATCGILWDIDIGKYPLAYSPEN